MLRFLARKEDIAINCKFVSIHPYLHPHRKIIDRVNLPTLHIYSPVDFLWVLKFELIYSNFWAIGGHSTSRRFAEEDDGRKA